MILLDTDHATVLRYAQHPRCSALEGRLRNSGELRIASTVVTLEEQARGWLAEINRWREVHQQIRGYDGLLELLAFYRRWEMMRFDPLAADKFTSLKQKKVRIGTQDLKIASIALVNDALLLSANLRDFQRVPGLRVENWLKE